MSAAFVASQPTPPDLAPATGRTAVILNANARRVTPAVRAEVQRVAPDADVFYTRSLEEAAFVTRRVADAGYGFVFTGGGDGTVVNTIDQVMRRLDETSAEHCPKFGILKLGTGNAVADFFGAGDFRDDLLKARTAPIKPLYLMDVAGACRTPFFGFGWDAFILNNYDQMKRAAEHSAVTRAMFKNVMGYLIAGVGKSVPELVLRQPSWQIRVTNTGSTGFRLDADGQVVERFAPGAVVYQGGARLGCFGTTPFYGFKFRILPFADRTPGMFHFRVLDFHPVAAVALLPQAWQGRLEHSRLFDFQLTACKVEIDGQAPLQIGGDAHGQRDHIEAAVVERPIPCLQLS